MRSFTDRLRHALLFEAIALVLVVPASSLLFHQPVHSMGVIVVVSAAVAALWNMVYNWLFDRATLRLRGRTAKTLPLRVLHAVLFEGGLLVLLLPFIAWYLGVTLWQALAMDVALALFYVVYAFVYNWVYDRVFPVPDVPARAG
ncbi:PACE efflux transporter [Wenxinia saemankumensis]|uniref:Uncharacterized membrane protein n=1 Tax=Wenxinia saemankumensis TaxID=1447782 RepID=A0A1M6BYU0_9RHOB|nr:PACE efflux transporter [Wenxinia saemankumensis]SHI53751.1 Uncharacterized membrane protein [Wenxinia saemankumensis]